MLRSSLEPAIGPSAGGSKLGGRTGWVSVVSACYVTAYGRRYTYPTRSAKLVGVFGSKITSNCKNTVSCDTYTNHMEDVTNHHGLAINLDAVELLNGKGSMLRLPELDGGSATRLAIGTISKSGAANRTNNTLKVFL